MLDVNNLVIFGIIVFMYFAIPFYFITPETKDKLGANFWVSIILAVFGYIVFIIDYFQK